MALTDMVLMPGADYQGICDQTRRLTGETGTLKSGEVVTKLSGVPAGGGGGGGSTGETTQLQVNALSSVVDRPLYCVWQTNDGWMGSQSFATLTSFTVPNVIVGGYVIFMRDPMEQALFSASDAIGVKFPPVAAMDQENDIADGALVVIVTAPSPSFNLKLLPQS